MQNNPEVKRAQKIISLLKEEFGKVKPALEFSSPFELLIATILSAQCTDQRVNIVTKNLFKKYKTPADYLNAEDEALEADIFSTGFYKQKAKSIKNCCKDLIENYGNEVPGDFEKLCSLPGVGRKTASVVAGNAFGIPAIAVDTHVIRLSNLLGFVESGDPKKIEIRLKELLPKKDWTITSHLFGAHGRKTCAARKPKCNACTLKKYCPSFNLHMI